MAILFIIIVLALMLGSAVLYAMNLHWWRVSLIAGVMFGAVALLWIPGVYGPSDRLKPGIDLAGGTRLVYDVVVPDGQAKGKVIEETIEILADRADPAGTRGLVWKQVAGNRIEVQMASAPAKVREARDAYDRATGELEKGNLNPGKLDGALKSDEPKALENLADGNAQLLTDLEELKAAYQERALASKRFVEARRQWDAVKGTIPTSQWNDNPVYQKFEQEESYFKTDAKAAFEELEDKVLRSNSFDLSRFDFLRAIPATELSEKQKAAGEKTPRQERLEKLLEESPNRAEQIEAAYNALTAYEAVKGPLDGPEDLIALLQGSGVLEFRIAVNPAEIATAQPFIDQLHEQGPRARPDADFRWFEVEDLKQYVDEVENRSRIEDWLALSLSVSADDQDEARAQIYQYFSPTRDETHGVIAQPYAGRLYLLLHNDEGNAMTREQDWTVTTVQRGVGQLGRPVVSFQLDGRGASYMSRLTGPNVDRPMAVLIDDQVLTTPGIRTELRSGIEISGDFSEAEVQYLRDTMRAGALEGQLSEFPVSQQTIGATLGADNIKSGFSAALTALVLVAIFMTIYYFFAGLVANFALAANMVLILGILALTQATFTLPGIAGLVLTIGMAVDANVLIFERIREELMDRKVSVEIAARQGYGKALSTILDANITTLLTCLILGYTATSDVKGFAVVLGIGILATLFTALFCTKVFIDLYIRYRKPTTLEMLPTMFPAMHKLMHPNVNWISKAKFLVPISALLLIFGLGEAFLVRGIDMLDIEFRSGSSVGFDLKPTGEEDEEGDPELVTLKIAEARERIDKVAVVAQAVQAARLAEEDYSATDSDSYKELEASYEEQLAEVKKNGLTENELVNALGASDQAKALGDLAAGNDAVLGELGTLADAYNAVQVELRMHEQVQEAIKKSYDRYATAMEDYERKSESGTIEKPDDVPDFSLLTQVQVVPTGVSGAAVEASGFNVATLITDSRAVMDLMNAAFADVLETAVSIEFEGQDLSAEQAGGIVQAMKTGVVGKAFGDAGKALPEAVRDLNLPEFAGGVAMFAQDLSQPLSIQEMTGRIERMRRQPPHDELGVRPFQVLGVERGAGFDGDGNERYESLIVVVHDNKKTDYSKTDTAEAFGASGGLADTEWKLLKDALQRDSSFSNVTVFNSQVSGTMKQQAVVAILLSLLAVVIYIWVRFGSFRYGLAAIAALVHDVAVALGVIALAGLAYNKLGADSPIVQFLMLDPFKINLAMIAAFLTIIGYSLNDTIVVFDRIRENRGRLSRATPEIINESINQTVSRTVLTSGTTLVAVGTLYVLGGPGVHGFAFAMLLGVLIGTYSSVAIAAPILVIGTKGQGPKAGPETQRPTSILADDEPDITSEPVGA